MDSCVCYPLHKQQYFPNKDMSLKKKGMREKSQIHDTICWTSLPLTIYFLISLIQHKPTLFPQYKQPHGCKWWSVSMNWQRVWRNDFVEVLKCSFAKIVMESLILPNSPLIQTCTKPLTCPKTFFYLVYVWLKICMGHSWFRGIELIFDTLRHPRVEWLCFFNRF